MRPANPSIPSGQAVGGGSVAHSSKKASDQKTSVVQYWIGGCVFLAVLLVAFQLSSLESGSRSKRVMEVIADGSSSPVAVRPSQRSGDSSVSSTGGIANGLHPAAANGEHTRHIIVGHDLANQTAYSLAPTKPGIWGPKPVPLCVKAKGAPGKHVCLPSYLVIGAAKGGTTSMYSNLIQHPQIYRAEKKEICWLRNIAPSQNPPKVAQYRSQFQAFPVDSGGITGEACPFYLPRDSVPELTSLLLPHVRIIVLLRDPTDRLFSMFNMRVRYHNDGFKTGKERLEDFVECNRDTNGLMQCSSSHHGTQVFIEQGLYAKQIRNWMEYFPLSPQWLIVKSEDMYTGENLIMMELQEHLGLDPFFTEDYKFKARNVHPEGQKVEWDLKLKADLQEYYSRFNKDLYELLDYDFGWERDQRAKLAQ